MLSDPQSKSLAASESLRAYRLQQLRYQVLARARRLWLLRNGRAIVVLAPAFYLAAQNTVMSSPWWVVLYRNVDDFAFHVTIRRVWASVVSGELSQAAGTFDYAYGSVFWIATALITGPGQALDSIPAAVLLGRALSVVSLTASAWATVTLYERRFGPAGLSGALLGALWILAPVNVLLSSRVQPTPLSTLFVCSAALVLVPPTSRLLTSKRIAIAGIIFGLGVGIKLPALAAYPIVAFLIVESGRHILRRLVMFSVLAGAFGAFAAMPALLYPPSSRASFETIVLSIRTVSHVNQDAARPPIFDYLVHIAQWFGSPWTLMAIALMLLGTLTRSRTFLPRAKFATIVVATLVVCLVVLYALVGARFAAYSAIYLHGLMPFVLVVLLRLIKVAALHREVASTALVFALAVNPLAVRTLSDFNYIGLYHSHDFATAKISVEEVKMRLDPLLGQRDCVTRVLQDYRAVFPYTRMDSDLDIVSSFDNFVDVASWFGTPDILVFLPESAGEHSREVLDEMRSRGQFLDRSYLLLFGDDQVEVFVAASGACLSPHVS